jgi:4-amino-4-deoxy-L-arabinose transferase-like glycosyltransferase
MSRDDGNENNTIRVPVIAWILFIAGVFRVTAVAFLFENLQVDRDAYLAIAQNLLDGNGYCSTVNQPTAFRPPLYPLLVASCIHLGGFVLLGAAQIVLGTATVWLTWLLAIRCRLSTRTAAIAATLVAADPLLVQYTTQAMTETLATFLVTMMLVATLWSGNEIAKVGVVGVLFGLAALCRPSIWAFGMLAGAVWVVETLRTRSSDGAFNPRVSSRHAKTEPCASSPLP